MILRGGFGSGLANQIADKHWQGGYPLDGHLLRRKGVGLLVLAACELQPECSSDAKDLFPGVRVVLAPLDDVEEGPTEDEARLAAQAAREVVRAICRGETALVTCQAGRNRSGLISALALILRFGMTGERAIETVRCARPKALSNTGFCRFLVGLNRRGKSAIG